MSTWESTELPIGSLPLVAGETRKFDIPSDIDQAIPKELLIYTFITVNNVPPGFRRGYYKIYTQRKNGTQYSFYMNVANTNDAVVNSENMWLPYGADFEKGVFVHLNAVEGTEIAPKTKSEESVGEILITGYKVWLDILLRNIIINILLLKTASVIL